MPFQKGNKLSKGRPPILLPEVQEAIDKSKNEFRLAIISRVEPHLIEWIDSIVAKGVEHGDVIKLRMLLEIVMGKIPEDHVQEDYTSQEKRVIELFRERLAQHEADRIGSDIPASPEEK